MGKVQKQGQKATPAAIVHHQEQVVTYQGPVPPPAIMEKLEAILPGAADRIFTMAEKEQDAAHEHQRHHNANAQALIRNEHWQNIFALACAFVISMTFAICGTILIMHGHTMAGGGLVGATLLGVTGSFLARWKQRQNNK